MHGTPAQQLFSRARRDFSHGCIRLEDPARFAEWVLRDQPDWTRERIDEAMQGERPTRVNLKQQLTVVLFYDTVHVNSETSSTSSTTSTATTASSTPPSLEGIRILFIAPERGAEELTVRIGLLTLGLAATLACGGGSPAAPTPPVVDPLGGFAIAGDPASSSGATWTYRARASRNRLQPAGRTPQARGEMARFPP